MFLIVFILLVIFATLFFVNKHLSIERVSVSAEKDLSIGGNGLLPVLLNDFRPSVSARAAIITDSSSQKILFAKNSDLRLSTASTAKIMTALVALSHYKEGDILTIAPRIVEGSRLGFLPGQQYYFKDVLLALMLPSANDAAYAIADNYPGGYSAFIEAMNKKARELGLSNTHFSDPAGLEDDTSYTTVVDMARLASIAIKNPTFKKVVSIREAAISGITGYPYFEIENLNELLGTRGVIGIKTGTTVGAGEVLVTSVEYQDSIFIIVVMQSQDRFTDTLTLIDFLENNVFFIKPDINSYVKN